MRKILPNACIAAFACWSWAAAAAEPMQTPMYRQWILQHSSFAMVGGRVISNNGNGWMFGSHHQTFVDGAVRESVSFNGNGTAGSMAYSYLRAKSDSAEHKEAAVELAIEVSSEGHFLLRYSNSDEPKSYFKLAQVPGRPLRLSLPPAANPRVVEAPTIWHLLIEYDDDCRQKLLPTLEAMRADWQLGRTAGAAEEELVRLAAVAQKPDRQQWAKWVEQLGDPLYTHRDQADRKLRAAGPVVLGYLTRLKMDRLDPEQQFRVRRIIRALSTQQGEDTPESVASMLIGDPSVWLAMLSRGDLATREAAAQQLEVLLGAPVRVDPKADPATQTKAREELRARIERFAAQEK